MESTVLDVPGVSMDHHHWCLFPFSLKHMEPKLTHSTEACCGGQWQQPALRAVEVQAQIMPILRWRSVGVEGRTPPQSLSCLQPVCA